MYYLKPNHFYIMYQVLEDQNVPSGLEIIMSLDGSHGKYARIPPSWRLHVLTHSPSKSFYFRMDVSSNTLIGDILSAAGKKALDYSSGESERGTVDGHVAAATFEDKVTKGKVDIPHDATVGQMDLFNRRSEFDIRVNFP